MMSYMYGILGVMLAITIVMDWQLTIRVFSNIILSLLLLILWGTNCQYYYLWRKYDNA
ncbi:hypothetical protein [Levilactobacillus huananensis]|uniref:hypothetical protein n=1 Tax=Levilactobacillus huananensis TaxID=2486019 RepID=UPI0013DE224F|nr:hypothetical protein [Levilactobacillus huananensis]